MLFAVGRRTVACWLRAAGVSSDFSDYYHFIASIGRRTEPFAARLFGLLLARLPCGPRILLAIDDTPTKRYGPKVQGAGIHHNPTPGPAGAKFLYGHVWVTLAWIVHHPRWGTLALPLLSKLYVRQKDIAKLPKRLRRPFQTKLQQAAELVQWAARIVISARKQLWIVVDGFFTKRPFLKPVLKLGGMVLGRLRKDAHLYDLPPKLKKGRRRGPGQPRKYGLHRICLAQRAGQPHGWHSIRCRQYGQEVTKTIKTFLATYHPAYGTIRVVIVREEDGPQFFFATGREASAREILEAVADRGAIEQTFHDLKEIWGAGQQQVRRLWANIGAWHLSLWSYCLVELWAWNKSQRQLCQRAVWDDADRRPSHADRRNALRRQLIREEFSAATDHRPLPQRIRRLFHVVLNLAG
jgi:hypothetical protein